MGWEPALPPAKCFEGVCLCQFELHRDLRPQAAGAQYLPSSYGFGIGSVKQDLTRDHRPTSCFPCTHTGRFKCYRLMNSSPNRTLAHMQRKFGFHYLRPWTFSAHSCHPPVVWCCYAASQDLPFMRNAAIFELHYRDGRSSYSVNRARGALRNQRNPVGS